METDWDHETPYQLLQIVNTHTCTCIGTYCIVGNFGYRILIWQYGNSSKIAKLHIDSFLWWQSIQMAKFKFRQYQL